MIRKSVTDRLLKNLTEGTLKITFPNGKTQSYGQGNPMVSMQFKTNRVVRKLIQNPPLGLGEGYMDKNIEVSDLAKMFELISLNKSTFDAFQPKRQPKLQANKRHHQLKQIQHHYDLGNDFYRLWLDNKTMAYTCAYFKTKSDSLEQAQIQKFDHVLRKLQLKPGMVIAELGCGWGHLLVHAVKNYGVKGIGVTLSKEQLVYARALAKKAGVADRARFELLNYQDLADRSSRQYDRVYSVGILEHVGRGNHTTYFKAVDKLLKPGGVSLLHSISKQDERSIDAWLDKYIFPGGYIPSQREITAIMPQFDFHLQDYENLRYHYALTLDEWWRRFERHKKTIIKMFDERFYRMWRLWLAASASGFRYGNLDLSQWVFTKGTTNDLPLTREHLYRK